MSKVLLTRPLDQSVSLTEKLKVHDIECAVAPMLEIESMVSAIPPVNHAQALVFSSQHGVNMFSRRCRENEVDARHLPAYCVGDATSAAAERAGFKKIRNAKGDGADLERLVLASTKPEGGVIVHVRGADVANDLAKSLQTKGYQTESTVIYNARTSEGIEKEIMNEMYAGEIPYVMFFSPRTAETFGILGRNQGFAAAAPQMTAICMSRAVAEAARVAAHWRSVRIADEPREQAMIDCLRDLVEG
ncbi:MAG: uroporphyrinogen-III synthase [Alphaproteobacteria bacterium]|nr:uroporphyrinogen-III synthase [Alphaproteobacteria bacterium SS10]